MQLMRGLVLAGLVLAVSGTAGMAQSLSPMRKSGVTPSDVKGYRLSVGNPYGQRMVFSLLPVERGFNRPAADAQINPAELVLAPGQSRQVILLIKIPPQQKERTIGLCVQPKHIEGPVLPRVCGTYTGVKLKPGAGS